MLKREFSEKTKFIVSVLFLLIGFGVTLAYIFLKPGDLTTASSAGDLLMGRCLGVNGGNSPLGGISTTEWYYGGEAKIVNIQIVFKLLFRFLTGNLRYVRLAAAAFFIIAILLTYIFMMYAAGMTKEGIFSAGFLAWPVGQWYTYCCLFSSRQAYYVAAAFFSFALILLCAKTFIKAEGKGFGLKPVVFTLILCAAALLISLDSSLMFKVFYTPLLVTALVFWFLESRKGSDRGSGNKTDFKLAVIAVLMFISSFAGNYIYENYLGKWYMIDQPVKNVYDMLFRGGIFYCIFDTFNFFGWLKDIPIMSINGILNCFGLLLIAFFIFSMVRLLKRFDTLSLPGRWFVLFFSCGFITSNIIFSSIPQSYSYENWTVLMVFSVPLITLELCTEDMKFFADSKGTVYALCVVSVVFLSFAEITSDKTDGDGVCIDLAPAAEYLKAADYSAGYAPYDQANVISELTNGIEMYGLSGVNSLDNAWEPGALRLRDQATGHISSRPEGAVFFVLPLNEEAEDVDLKLASLEEKRVFEDGSCVIFGFDCLEEYQNLIEAAGDE